MRPAWPLYCRWASKLPRAKDFRPSMCFFLNVTATGLPDFTGLVVCVACTIFQLCLLADPAHFAGEEEGYGDEF